MWWDYIIVEQFAFPLLSIMRVLQIFWELETSDSTDPNWPRTPVHVIWRFERVGYHRRFDLLCCSPLIALKPSS